MEASPWRPAGAYAAHRPIGPRLRLTQYLVEPGCTPSRAALITGQYSIRNGLSSGIVGHGRTSIKIEPGLRPLDPKR